MALAALHPLPPLDPVEVVNEAGGSRVVFVCEHASAAIPDEFGDLGLPAEARLAHIAWDPGALAVATALSERFDAPLVAGRISRLVYDVNRPPEAPSAIPERSEVYAVPGNRDLPGAARADRVARVYRPFHARLAAVLEARPDAPVVTIHTFTPVYFGEPREWEVGVIHDADSRLAESLLAALRSAGVAKAGLNVPYSAADGVTHTLALHATPHGRTNAMVEIRNDLVGDAAGVAHWAARLGDALAAALAAVEGERR
jgi:predicted N-formylglutamate amidohydrolase